jgi:hypothetical protein
MNTAFISLLISFAGFVLAFAVYQLSKQHLRESWLKRIQRGQANNAIHVDTTYPYLIAVCSSNSFTNDI